MLTEPDIELAPGVRLPAAALHWTFSRGGGPGGQNVNKVSTRATLRVALDDLRAAMPGAAVDRLVRQAGAAVVGDAVVLHCGETRSQWTNRRRCVLKLGELVAAALVRPKVRKPTRPSKGAERRRRAGKERTSAIKQRRKGVDGDPG